MNLSVNNFCGFVVSLFLCLVANAATLTGDKDNIVVNIFPSAERGGLGDRVSNLYMAHKIVNTYKNVTVNYLVFKDSFASDFQRLDFPYWMENKDAFEAKKKAGNKFIELTYRLGGKPFNILVVPFPSDSVTVSSDSDSYDSDDSDLDDKVINLADTFFDKLSKNRLDIKPNKFTYNVTFSTARYRVNFNKAFQNIMFEKMNVNEINLNEFAEYNSQVPDENYSESADDGYFPDYRLYVSSSRSLKPPSELLDKYGKKCQGIGFSYTHEEARDKDEYGLVDDSEEKQSENYAKGMYQLSKGEKTSLICIFVHSKDQWDAKKIADFFQVEKVKIIKNYDKYNDYLVAEIDHNFIITFWKALPLRENIALIAHSNLPVAVTGDMSLTLALEFRKPFLYETLQHKEFDGRSIGDKALRRIQSLSGIELALPKVGVDTEDNFKAAFSVLVDVMKDYEALQKILIQGLKNIQTMPENLFTLMRIQNSQKPEVLSEVKYEKQFETKKRSYIQIPFETLSREISNLFALLDFMQSNRPNIYRKDVVKELRNGISSLGVTVLDQTNVKDREKREKIYEEIALLRRKMVNTEPSDFRLNFNVTIETPYKKREVQGELKEYRSSQRLFIDAFQRIVVYRDNEDKLTVDQANQCLKQLKQIDLEIYQGKLKDYEKSYDQLFLDIEERSCKAGV